MATSPGGQRFGGPVQTGALGLAVTKQAGRQQGYVDQSDPKVAIFMAWANTHLRPRGMTVSNLAIDFDDGLMFVELVRALFGPGSPFTSASTGAWVKQVRKCERHPTTTLHKLVRRHP